MSPGNIFQVAKDWRDYKAAFYFLYRTTGGSATTVCVLELLEENTKGEVQTGSKAMFVEEHSAMKLLASPRSGDDNDFLVAGGPLVSEWSRLKKKGAARAARRRRRLRRRRPRQRRLRRRTLRQRRLRGTRICVSSAALHCSPDCLIARTLPMRGLSQTV